MGRQGKGSRDQLRAGRRAGETWKVIPGPGGREEGLGRQREGSRDQGAGRRGGGGRGRGPGTRGPGGGVEEAGGGVPGPLGEEESRGQGS